MSVIQRFLFVPIFCSIIVLLFSSNSLAFDFFGSNEPVTPYDKFIIRIITENDVYLEPFFDEYYTAGHSIGFTSREMDFSGEDAENYKFLSYLGKIGLANYPRVTKFNIDLSQEIYTPKDRSPIPDKNDRPYAGYLYLSLGLINRNNNIEEHFWVNVGVVGPAALAKQAQDFVHKYISNDALMPGWDTQIGNEFALNFYYQITRKFTLSDKNVASDILLTADTAVGNVDIHLGADIRFRLGHNLHVDFGVPKVNISYNASSVYSNDFSIYGFVGAGGRIVGRNLLLSGNTFTSGTGISLYPFLYNLEAGVAVVFKGFRFSYVYTYKSKEFTSQKNNSSFGSILLELAF